MALTPAPILAPTGLDRFSPDQLLRMARLCASDPALMSMVDPRDEEARWIELESSAHHHIWLLSWPTGTFNGWHDHGESAGAFQVLRGTLLEQTSANHRRGFRTVVAGEGRCFESNHIHHLANVRAGTALSVHVYAPRLTATTRYAITPTGLQSQAVDQVGLDW
jgi:quercetin dioxygenase-like cupin family protein